MSVYEAFKLDGQVCIVACDVTSDQALESRVRVTLEAFGKITLLVNNAGGGANP